MRARRNLITKAIRRLKTALYSPQPDKNEVYLHFDISSATDGYEREIHHDLDERLVVFLVHFSDWTEACIGGEFGVHRYERPRNLKDCECQAPGRYNFID